MFGKVVLQLVSLEGRRSCCKQKGSLLPRMGLLRSICNHRHRRNPRRRTLRTEDEQEACAGYGGMKVRLKLVKKGTFNNRLHVEPSVV